jgi:L-glyceraldehyde 3-phosphate reductase
LGTPCLIHQPVYNLFNRWIENGLTQVFAEEGIGCIVFCPLAQGLLTDRYLQGIPDDSRAAKPHGFLKREHVTEDKISKVCRLQDLARRRGQTLAQMALAWVLRLPQVTSALMGASRPSQIEDATGCLTHLAFTEAELREIDAVLAG